MCGVCCPIWGPACLVCFAPTPLGKAGVGTAFGLTLIMWGIVMLTVCYATGFTQFVHWLFLSALHVSEHCTSCVFFGYSTCVWLYSHCEYASLHLSCTLAYKTLNAVHPALFFGVLASLTLGIGLFPALVPMFIACRPFGCCTFYAHCST